jgi:hypothetical protein
MDPDLSSIRHQLAVLARRKRARTLGWPRDWQPTEVTNPEDGQPFTPPGAWEFIADVLEQRSDIQLEVVQLEEPAGASGYVLCVPLKEAVLYIKLQLGSGRIIGRSFHYSRQVKESENR